MHCVECNSNKLQREMFEKTGTCPLCNGHRHISFHRYVQWKLGFVLWLNDDGNHAPVETMKQRCEDMILRCYREYHKNRLPIIKPYPLDHGSPVDVVAYYIDQFKE